MMVIGFGFLMAFLKRNGFSSVGLNFMLCALVLLWAVLVNGLVEKWWHDESGDVEVSVSNLVTGDFAVAAVLITYGAVLGKVTPAQLVWMSVFEIVFYAINERILVDELRVSDVGGSMVVHLFGAVFGMAVTAVASSPFAATAPYSHANGSVYSSDLFAMIGTLFLWAYWPSFNSAFAGDEGGARNRTIVNTVLSLCGSCLSAFMCSQLFRGGRFDMVDVQNATLAGGVAVGSLANLMISPALAIVTGVCGGAISALGFAYLSDALLARFGLQDTCGVLNLHGTPALFSALAAVAAAAGISDSKYGGVEGIGAVYAARADGRSSSEQAFNQFMAILCTIGIALLSGAFTGLVMKAPVLGRLTTFFQDAPFFHLPEDEEEAASREATRSGDNALQMASLQQKHSSSSNDVTATA